MAEVELAKAIKNYNPSYSNIGSSEEFKQLAYGFCQSEETVSARIRGDKFIYPLVNLGQNYTP